MKRTHDSFPTEGIQLHISVDDALASGIAPGDPAVVEVTVRSPTVQEWLVEGLERTFETEDEESEFFGRCPVPGQAPAPEPAASVAQPEGAAVAQGAAEAEAGDDHPRIRWPLTAVGA